MSTSTVKAIPDGMHSLTPHLVCAGAAEAIEFYKKAFNAVELARLPGPKALKGSPVVLHLYVEDVDAQVKQAVAAGAKLTLPVADMFWGDRYGQVEDPFGHKWSVATHTRDLTPEEIKAGMAQQQPC